MTNYYDVETKRYVTDKMILNKFKNSCRIFNTIYVMTGTQDKHD